MRYFLFGVVAFWVLSVALGPWFWILLGAGIVIFIAIAIFGKSDSGLSEEEQKLYREKLMELRHAQRMAEVQEESHRRRLAIEAEQQKQLQSSALWKNVGSTAAKVGVTLAVQALTGQSHRHRH